MDLGWSVEEAEVAAKDRSMWKFLVNQAAGASMHEADRYRFNFHRLFSFTILLKSKTRYIHE